MLLVIGGLHFHQEAGLSFEDEPYHIYEVKTIEFNIILLIDVGIWLLGSSFITKIWKA